MDYEVQNKFLNTSYLMENKYKQGFCFSALYGSQNYGLSTPTSDVDVKVAFLPSPEDVLLVNKRQATTYSLDNNSTDNTVLAKDLRDVFTELYKQNLNFLEVLATPYFYTSHNFHPLFEELRNNSNEVARYYERGFYFCTCGLFNKLDVDFQKDRFDYKKFVYGLYLTDFVKKYANQVEFKDCFTSENADFYRTVKTSQNLPKEQCNELWEDAKNTMNMYFNKAKNMSDTKKDYTKRWMDELLYDYVWKYVVLEGK